MKVNKFGRAAILSPTQITLLFNEGFTKPRDRALFGVCLYAAARINEACTLLRGDVIGIKGVRNILVFRPYNTKGKQSTREIQVHPQLKEYLEEHHKSDRWYTRPLLFPGRHGRGSIHKASAERILRDTCLKLEIEGVSTHSFRRTALRA
jgi:integrase/recombinase XerD